MQSKSVTQNQLSFDEFKAEVLKDYKVAVPVENEVYWEDVKYSLGRQNLEYLVMEKKYPN